jgi:hypothetical protein
MLAYTTISDEAEQEEKESATASFDRIEALVSTCFKSSNDNKQERKRKSSADNKPQKQEFTRQVSIAKAYEQRGSKARAVRRKDNEQDRLDRLARTNDDVDVDKQQTTRRVHRSQEDTDTGFLDNEVQIYEIECEQRTL